MMDQSIVGVFVGHVIIILRNQVLFIIIGIDTPVVIIAIIPVKFGLKLRAFLMQLLKDLYSAFKKLILGIEKLNFWIILTFRHKVCDTGLTF